MIDLNLGFNQLTLPENLKEIITKCSNLRNLDLSFNKFGPQGISVILESLCEFEGACQLESLNISRCGANMLSCKSELIENVQFITSGQIARIASMHTLKSLIFDGNQQKDSLQSIVE